MEPKMFAPAVTPWYENISLPFPDPSESPHKAEWELVRAIIPPYIFTLCLFGLIFNSFVLAVNLLHRDQLTVAEIYLSNLALADFLLLCSLPFLAKYIQDDYNWTYGDTMCKMVNSVIVVNFYTSTFSLVMISVDRYLALVKTMSAGRLRRTPYAKLTCGVLWMLGLLLSLPTAVHRKVKFIDELQTLSCIHDYGHDSPWKLAHEALMNVLGFVLPFPVIAFSSCSIIRVLVRRRDIQGFHDIDDRKATVLVYAVTLLFLLCWGPFQAINFLDLLCDVGVLDVDAWHHTLDVGRQVSVYLAFLNSALNPVLYVFSGQYFRRKIGAIYRRSRYDRRGSDMTTFQRSVVSTYINRADQIKTVVLPSATNQTGLRLTSCPPISAVFNNVIQKMPTAE